MRYILKVGFNFIKNNNGDLMLFNSKESARDFSRFSNLNASIHGCVNESDLILVDNLEAFKMHKKGVDVYYKTSQFGWVLCKGEYKSHFMKSIYEFYVEVVKCG